MPSAPTILSPISWPIYRTCSVLWKATYKGEPIGLLSLLDTTYPTYIGIVRFPDVRRMSSRPRPFVRLSQVYAVVSRNVRHEEMTKH